METVPTAFPATLEIDYPDGQLDRLATFFRLFTIIPIAVVLALVTRSTVCAASQLDRPTKRFVPAAARVVRRR